MAVRLAQREKACTPISVTVKPLILPGIVTAPPGPPYRVMVTALPLVAYMKSCAGSVVDGTSKRTAYVTEERKRRSRFVRMYNSWKSVGWQEDGMAEYKFFFTVALILRAVMDLAEAVGCGQS